MRKLGRTAVWTLALGLCASSGLAQTQGQWVFGDNSIADRPHRVTRLSDGDLLTVSDTCLTRHDGVTTLIEWETCFASDFYPKDVIEDSSGRLVVVGGRLALNQPWETALVFLDASGLITNVRSYPGDHGTEHCELIETSDQGFLIVHELLDPVGYKQPFLIKTDSSGNELWMNRYDVMGSNEDSGEFAHVFETKNDQGLLVYHLTGYHQLEAFGIPKWETLMATIDTNGNVVQAATMGFDNVNDYGRGLIPYQHGFLVTGYSKQLGEGGGTYLMKLDANFQVLWYYGIQSFQGNRELVLDANGEVWLSGTSTALGQATQACLLKFDLTAGLTITGTQYGGTIGEYGYDLAVDGSGFAVVGASNSFGSPNTDRYLVRVDSTGASGCLEKPFNPVAIPEPLSSIPLALDRVSIESIPQAEIRRITPPFFEEALCESRQPAPTCHVNWDAPFCIDENSIEVAIQVCNPGTVSASVQLSFAGLAPPACGSISGPTGFTVVSPGNPVTVLPGQCEPVVVEIDRPAGMNTLNQVGCYEVTLVNLVDGTTNTCMGSVQDRRDLCPLVPDLPVELPVGVATELSVEFENTGYEGSIIDWRAVAYGPDMKPSNTISLDGGEPGTFTGGELETEPGAPGRILLTARPLEPIEGFADLVFFTRAGDEFTPLCSIALQHPVEPVCPGDYNEDGVVDGPDLATLLGAWNTIGSEYDLTGDQFVDGQDLAALLAKWGGCSPP